MRASMFTQCAHACTPDTVVLAGLLMCELRQLVPLPLLGHTLDMHASRPICGNSKPAAWLKLDCLRGNALRGQVHAQWRSTHA
jgi:hypothetical protein